MAADDYLKMLGLPAKDSVTGFSGVVECVAFDLYGCVQVCMKPPVDKDGKAQDAHWYDHKRIEIANGAKPVMAAPVYKTPGMEIGSAEKPPRS